MVICKISSVYWEMVDFSPCCCCQDYYVTIRNHIVIQTGFRVSDLLTGTICKNLFGVRHLLVCFPVKLHIWAEI